MYHGQRSSLSLRVVYKGESLASAISDEGGTQRAGISSVPGELKWYHCGERFTCGLAGNVGPACVLSGSGFVCWTMFPWRSRYPLSHFVESSPSQPLDFYWLAQVYLTWSHDLSALVDVVVLLLTHVSCLHLRSAMCFRLQAVCFRPGAIGSVVCTKRGKPCTPGVLFSCLCSFSIATK